LIGVAFCLGYRIYFVFCYHYFIIMNSRLNKSKQLQIDVYLDKAYIHPYFAVRFYIARFTGEYHPLFNIKGACPMFISDDVKENFPLFLVELYLQTQGDPSIKVSMYDVGETIGLDRTVSSRTAEELIGTGLAEIKTLNGGIGITADGADEAQKLGASLSGEGDKGHVLGNSAVLNQTDRQVVEEITTGLKSQVGEKNLDFNSLGELMADLKSVDAQLSSPNPKTAIIRECFQSIMAILQKANDVDSLTRIKSLLGE